jgi:hypothetical protein
MADASPTSRSASRDDPVMVDWTRLIAAAADVPVNPEHWTVYDAALAYSVGAVSLEAIEAMATAQ